MGRVPDMTGCSVKKEIAEIFVGWVNQRGRLGARVVSTDCPGLELLGKGEGFELPTNRRKWKPRNEAAARRVRMGAKKASKKH